VVEELGLGHVGVGVDALPERPTTQISMGESFWCDGQAVRGRKDRRMRLGGGAVFELSSHECLDAS
jgi:hypothetical protein